MIEIRETEEYADWFARLRDREAKSRILARIRRLSLGNPGDIEWSVKVSANFVSTSAQVIGSTARNKVQPQLCFYAAVTRTPNSKTSKKPSHWRSG
jgi:hypothetical protein